MRGRRRLAASASSFIALVARVFSGLTIIEHMHLTVCCAATLIPALDVCIVS